VGRPVSHLVVIGDVLLDRDLLGRVERLCPDAPAPVLDAERSVARAGGAGLAATLAAADGHSVVLVTGLGRGPAGTEVAGLLAAAGVDVVDLGLDGATPEKVRVRADGHTLVRIDHGGSPAPVGPAGVEVERALSGAAAVLVSDYGRGVAAEAGVRRALAALPPGVPVVWDPHPKGARPVPGGRLATPNRKEAARFAPGIDGDGLAAHAARARALVDLWEVAAVAVTLGSGGALLAGGDVPPLVVPAVASAGDPCGAGDRFASAAAGLLAQGALPSEAVTGAVAAASSFVEGAGAPAPSGQTADGPTDGFALAERVRAGGGTVVAAGGCFDLLHAGHVQLLADARALGDCLIVCLNSDDSIRRLKGPNRPLVPAADRAAVLHGLASVDAVVVFEEDTPLAVLDRLRPHVFAKGADYAVSDLPEAALLSGWGGQAVVLPFLGGRSTTRLVQEMSHTRA